jgi:hypothetical protein
MPKTKRPRTPSPDPMVMSDSEIYAEENFNSVTEDLAHSFAMEMDIDIDFSAFCLNQLEKELRTEKSQIILPEELEDLLKVYMFIVTL